MVYQLSTLVTRVQQRIRDTSYSSTEIAQYINDTINDIYNEYRLPFMESTVAYTLTANNSDITHGTGLPADYVQAVDLILGTQPSGKTLTYVDYRQIDRSTAYNDLTSTLNTVPTYWYYFNEIINTYPASTVAQTVTLLYYSRPTDLSADADVPTIPSNFGEILVMGAAYRVMQVKDNYDQATILQNKYDEILDKLVVKSSQHQVGTATRVRINRNTYAKPYF